MIYGKELVKCKTLDTVFKENKIEHIDVLKIDVEGTEHMIFGEKSFGNVAPKIDLIIGEAHWNLSYGGIPMLIPIMLEQWGFKTEFIDLEIPNMIYVLTIMNEDGTEFKYEYKSNTIFVAKHA